MIGLGDSRMTARTMPSTIPMAMATAVSSSVTSSPRRTRDENRYWPTTSHWKRGSRLPPRSTVENASEWTSMAASTSRTAALTHRPGWRSGTAVSVSLGCVAGIGPLSWEGAGGGVAIVPATPAGRRPGP